MEHVAFENITKAITSGDSVDDVYHDLMTTEANTLRLVERIADDNRSDALARVDIAALSLTQALTGFGSFWSDIYDKLMKGDTESAMREFRTPAGMLNLGMALVLITLVLAVST
jgi:hypothetical protein